MEVFVMMTLMNRLWSHCDEVFGSENVEFVFDCLNPTTFAITMGVLASLMMVVAWRIQREK